METKHQLEGLPPSPLTLLWVLSALCAVSCTDLPAVIGLMTVSLELQSLLKMQQKHSEDALDTHPIFWEKIATKVIELGS